MLGPKRVYVQVVGEFSYRKWLSNLKAGKSFITRGPFVSLTVNGKSIGEEIALRRGEEIVLQAEALPPGPPIEILQNGHVIASAASAETPFTATVEATDSFWATARIVGAAETNPVYAIVDAKPIWSEESARALMPVVDQAMAWVEREGQFDTAEQKREILTLFGEANRLLQNGNWESPA